MKLENTLNTKIVILAVTLCLTAGLVFTLYSFQQERDYNFKLHLNNLKNAERNILLKFDYLNDKENVEIKSIKKYIDKELHRNFSFITQTEVIRVNTNILGVPSKNKFQMDSEYIPLSKLTYKDFIYDGKKRNLKLVSSLPFDLDHYLLLYITIDKVPLIQSLQKDFKDNLFLLTALTIGAIFIVLLIAQNIIRPLHQLISLSSRIQGVDQEYEQLGEVEKISNTINYLSTELLKVNQTLTTQKMALDSAAIVIEIDREGRILSCNDKYQEISGYKIDELNRKKDIFLEPEEIATKDHKEIWEVINSGNVWRGELKQQKKEGSPYWVNATIFPYKSESQEVSKFISIQFDITDRKHFERQIIENEKRMNQIMKTRSAFLANMSHEVRTPLTHLLGISEILSDTELSPKQREHLNTILNSGEELLGIVNKILDLSNLEAGEIYIDKKEVETSLIFENAFNHLLNFKYQNPNIDLILDYDPDTPQFVLTDEEKVKDVIYGLLENSYKYTKNGSILLKTKILERDLLNHSVEMAITIRDTGSGIKEEKIPHLFNHFYSSNEKRPGKSRETELSLSVTKKIIEEMNGSISVSSEIGKGTIFTIQLTLEYLPEKELDENEFSNQLEGANVLIFDPDMMNTRVLCKYLNYHNVKMIKRLESIDEFHNELKFNNLGYFDFVFVDEDLQIGQRKVYQMFEEIDSTMKRKVFRLCHRSKKLLNDNAIQSFAFQGALYKPYYPTELKDEFNGFQEEKILKKYQENYFTKIKVLIAEDCPESQDLIQHYLSNKNLEVIFANNGRQALEKIRSHKDIDLIFMDIQMPKLNGIEATTYIKQFLKDNDYSPIPIIALTANAKEKSLNKFFDQYLVKPVKKETLLKCITNYCNLAA